MARTAAQIEASLAKLRRQRDALSDGSSSDPATSRLAGTGLRQQRQRSDTFMRRRSDLAAKIRREESGLAQARGREARATQAAGAPTSAADLAGARGIRTRFGVYRVLQVNKTSVTVEGDTGPERVPFNKITRVYGPAPEAPRAASSAAGRSSGS